MLQKFSLSVNKRLHMKKIFLVLILAGALASITKYGHAHGLSCGLYTAEPPFIGSNVTPSTHILLDNSGSMHEHAYIENEITIKYNSNNYVGYTGYNSTNEYYGYFEPKSFYDYDSSNNRFYENQTGKWYGNFLNWTLMHRVDVIRKVLTGGAYAPVNATHGTYKIERTDGGYDRGMLHAYDDSTPGKTLDGQTSHMTPYQEKIALWQNSPTTDDFLYIGTISSISGTTWTISGFKTTKFIQRVLSERKYGVIDKFEDSLRFSLFKFDTNTSNGEGARIIHYMGDNATLISQSINGLYPTAWTPLAESLYTICGYIQQKNTKDGVPPRYTEYSYKVGTGYPDPFYFKEISDTIYCSQQNVIIITDGEPTTDTNLPSSTFSSDQYESGWLDDVAHWAYTTDMRTDNIEFPGNQFVNIFTVFAFGSGSNLLKSAAIHGGGTIGANGIPDNYFEAQNGADLEVALTEAFNTAQNRVSAGAASSVVSTSRSGQGLLYQSVFYPELGDPSANSTQWAGDVFAYWVDDYGLLRQDDNENFKLDVTDSRVIVFNKNGQTKACIGGVVTSGVCNGTEKDMSDVKFVWQASKWLNDNNLNPSEQRSSLFSDNRKRRIFTWTDAFADGKVDTGEFTDFIPTNVNSKICPENVVKWIRGLEQTGLRSRKVDFGVDQVTWRLGDIINSSAVAVGAPSENYDLIWKDSSYTAFYQKFKNRRKMIYFGANDGMLHALNGGYYDPETKQYWKNPDKSNSGIDIGGEMWAYVPYNLLPHLSCLTNPNYRHQYFVDLSPRVFDARIFNRSDPDRPNGWGTILVAGMRFGGDGQQDLVVDGRTFGSSYFMFDITDPEEDPIFLGEFTYNLSKPFKFGYTIGAPTLVPVKDSTLGADDPKEPSKNVRWYMVFGTGPETTAGASFSNARVLVVPMDQVVDTSTIPHKANKSFPLRLDSTVKANTLSKTTLGFKELPKSNSFVSTDFASVDYNFDFFVDILYYGVTEKANQKPFTGSLHRLKVEDGPNPSSWNQMKLIDDVGPISGTPNVGFYEKNVWVFFGTGKFWDVNDKIDRSIQTIYGVMEPKKTDKAYNFSNINANSLLDVTNVQVVNDGNGTLNCTGACPDMDKVTPKTVFGLRDYIVNESSVDGWRRNLRSGERVLGQPTLFGGLANFVAYTPNNDLCVYGGNSTRYALDYLPGRAWIENVFGDDSSAQNVPFLKELGTGMGTTASLHIGSQDGSKAFITLDDGTLIEIDEPNLPIKRVRTGKGGWHTLGLD
jgi:type IV pilus assembly protein PilY1